MEKIIKMKYEYCHIDTDKIIITKTLKIQDLVSNYAKSINDFFKTLMVLFIFIPIFAELSMAFYYMENYGISIFFLHLPCFFLIMAFYLLLFTSVTPVIYKDKIVKIKIKKTLLFNFILIKYKDYGRIKSRAISLQNDQNEINMALEILLTDKLIENKIK